MKNKKIFITLALLIGLLFLVNSRRVDKTTFDIMVLFTKEDILKTCIQYKKYKSGLIKEKPSSYYNGFDLDELCNDDEKINDLAKEEMKKFYRKNYKFVF